MPDTFAYVLDASVGIKLFIEEEDSDKVDALFQRFTDAPNSRFYVPALFYTECTNILWKLARRGDRTPENVQADVQDLISLALDRVDTLPFLPEILNLASTRDVTVYDASYVITAKQQGIPFITADERLVNKLKKDDAQVLLLRDLT